MGKGPKFNQEEQAQRHRFRAHNIAEVVVETSHNAIEWVKIGVAKVGIDRYVRMKVMNPNGEEISNQTINLNRLNVVVKPVGYEQERTINNHGQFINRHEGGEGDERGTGRERGRGNGGGEIKREDGGGSSTDADIIDYINSEDFADDRGRAG